VLEFKRMVASVWDLTIDQGSDFSLQFTITQSDGTLLPSTGFSARAQIRSDDTPTGTLIATFVATFLADGIVVISMTGIVSEPLAAGKYYWDLETFADGPGTSVAQWLRGRVTLRQNYTR